MNGSGGAAVEVTLKALYNYTADDDDELTFEEGDEIVKLSEPDSEGRIEIIKKATKLPIFCRLDRR